MTSADTRQRRPVRHRQFRGVELKIILPIVVVMGFLSAGLYGFALRSISDFANERIQEDLERNSRDVFSICDAALQSLLAAGQGGDEVAGRVKRGRALGEIEEYLRQNNLAAVVYLAEDEKILFDNAPPSAAHRVALQSINENTVVSLPLGDKNYYVRRFQFELWNWHVVLIKDGDGYADLVTKVQSAYIGTGAFLLIASLLLVYYLKRVTQTEKDLHAAKEAAEKASLAKTRFLAAASHDLRQPMQTVSLLVGVLRERTGPPEDVDLIDKIRRSVNAMEKLFENLLEISKLDADAVKPNISEFPIADLLQLIETNYGPQAVVRNLQLRIVYSSMVARSDPVLLASMVGNLVSNAIRYTERGKILVGCRRRADKLVISVLDTGVGIPQQHMHDIFEEFVQLPRPGSDRNNGLGLGLSIVKRCAELLGYPLRVESAVGRGSVFSVEIPRAQYALTSVSPRQPSAAINVDVAGAFIVVIDDDPENVVATESLCRLWGCHVLTAGSAREATEKLQKHLRSPDLIITDYRLEGGLNGLSAVQEIRGLAQARIPAIIVTGDVSVAGNRINQSPCEQLLVIHKPVNADKLRRCVEDLLSSHGSA